MASGACSFTALVLSSGLLDNAEFHIADVGVSGGFQHKWNALGDRFSGVGFDPLLREVERLRAAETNPRLQFEAAFVTCRDYDRLFPVTLRENEVLAKDINPFPRSSSVAAAERLNQNYIQEHFNAGAEIAYTDRHITLDERYHGASRRPTFIKIDTDGFDLPVLLGARELLADHDVLGLEIEAQFHGAVHEYSNTFGNIDRLLRSFGFTLFDLTTNRYSRAALPAPFEYDILAQTVTGQLLWGDALYFRDYGETRYEQMFGGDANRQRLLMLACLWNIHGLHDCAAELLTVRDALMTLPNREALLDALAHDAGIDGTYAEYQRQFDLDPQRLFPSHLAREATAAADAAAADTAPPDSGTPAQREDRTATATDDSASLREENQELRAKVRQLKERGRELKTEVASLRERLERARLHRK